MNKMPENPDTIFCNYQITSDPSTNLGGRDVDHNCKSVLHPFWLHRTLDRLQYKLPLIMTPCTCIHLFTLYISSP